MRGEVMNTDPEEFKKTWDRIPEATRANVWLIPLKAGSKEPDIPKGAKLKDPTYRLTYEQARARLTAGDNVGIYALPGGLLFLDTDTKAGNLVLPQENINTIPATMTAKTRNGGRQYYYLNNGKIGNNNHAHNGIKAGEIRAEWLYVVAPGSFVKPDKDATPDATGLYSIVNDALIITLEAVPAGIVIKPKAAKNPGTGQKTYLNDLKMPLFEIRRKDPKLDELLKGATEADRSGADYATAQKLYFWRFSDQDIKAILQEYRPYGKTIDRADYLDMTLSNLDRTGARFDPNYNGNGAQTTVNTPSTPETPQHIKDRANEILDKGDPVQFIFDVHQSLHIGDPLISKILIASIGSQSANNTQGIHPKLDGQSGKGKSHAAAMMAHLIPREFKITGSVSDKALYYNTNLRAGSVIYSDDVDLSEDLSATIKRATTNYQGETEHHTLNKERGLLITKLPARLSWWLTSVNNDQSLQIINRQFGGSVDETPEQDSRIFEFQVSKAMFGTIDMPETDDVLVCREIIKDIKKHVFNVRIPFSYLIEWKDKGNRRNFEMFEDMIKAFAVFRYRQRASRDDILFAEIADYDDAEQLYSKKAANQRTKLSDSELRLCTILADKDEADIKTLMRETGLSQGRISVLINGKKYTDSGLIHKVKGFSIEQRTEALNPGDLDNTAKVTKKYFSLEGFNPEVFKASVVEIGEKERSEYLAYYRVITGLLLSKTDKHRGVITDITLINKIHSNVKYQDILNSLFSPKSSLIHDSANIGNIANNPTTDTENKNKYPGNKGGNNPRETEQGRLNNFNPKNEPIPETSDATQKMQDMWNSKEFQDRLKAIA